MRGIMKGSTLHRSGLTKERMSMLENMRPNNLENNEVPQYKKAQENELDILYKNVEKTFLNAKANINKTPAAYLLVGFISGVIFTLIIVGIVAISSHGNSIPEENYDEVNQVKTEVSKQIDNNSNSTQSLSSNVKNEQYVIKSGDTIDKIAKRFYGRYDTQKIDEILRINNIKDPSKLQLGQTIIIPVER